MKTSREFKIQSPSGTVSALLDTPSNALAGLILAHGAGAGMQHPFMANLATALCSAGFTVLRFQFPYMEAKQRRTDSPAIATATVAAAMATLQENIKAPIFAGGKSFGARMTTTAAAEGLLPGLSGILCFGFPLHPAGEPSTQRAKHLARVPYPTLFLQGTRDKLADLELMRGVCTNLPKATLSIIEGADHGFDILKRSGRTVEQVMQELVHVSAQFVREVLNEKH
jgi:predicted alpha/beta-hydrolase family hydrolase